MVKVGRFFINPIVKRKQFSIETWENIIKKNKVKHIGKLMKIVLDSEKDFYSKEEGIKNIFRIYKISPNVIEVFK